MDAHATQGGDAATAARLTTAPIELVGQFAAASNGTFLVSLGDRRDRPSALDQPAEVALADLDGDGLAVYKPARGEAPLWDFPHGSLHRREVAAYELSRALGWDLVPVTVLRDDAPLGRGSLQRFVPHNPGQHYFWLLEHGDAAVTAQLRRMVAFDLVIDNADRKGGHVLLERCTGPAQIRLVDHGVSFNADAKLRTVAWHFAGEPIAVDERRDVAGLEPQLDGDLGVALGRLLTPPELQALRQRVRHVADLARFPAPAGQYPFPWPML